MALGRPHVRKAKPKAGSAGKVGKYLSKRAKSKSKAPRPMRGGYR